MLSSMSAEEYCDYRNHFADHGFTSEIEDWRTGQICATTWNVGVITSGGKPEDCRQPSEFMLNPPEQQQKEKTDEELEQFGSELIGGIRLGN